MHQMHRISVLTLLLSLIIITEPQINSTCPQNCASCNSSTSFCNACVEGFEPSHTGACIPSSTIQNCQLFGVRDTCIICKPTFRLLPNNTCTKMWDGCLVAGPMGSCSKCMSGALRNQYGQCSTKTLNCLKTNPSGECILCEQRGYRLQYGRCINSDPNCRQTDPFNGLCKSCVQGYKLLEYRCIARDELPNCYIVASDEMTCSICKLGYESFYGRCQTVEYIDKEIYENAGPNPNGIINTNNKVKKCPSTQYYNVITHLCYPLPAFCQRFDYGLRRCVSCLAGYIILGSFCRDPSLKNCQKFDTNNPYICDTCFPQYYLTISKLCKEFPPFCSQVTSQKCTKCIDLFLLNSNSQCEDPNCQIFDSMTNICTECKESYYRNSTTSICMFRDANCEVEGPGKSCLRCRGSYVYDTWRKVCKFRDPECKIFSEKDVCLECRANFYLNSKTNICMQLPYKCLNSDKEGNCEYCAQGYTLTPTRQCKIIVNISNCEMPSFLDSNVCDRCKEGYYKDERATCVELPIFCEVFDSVRRSCTKCNRNSVLRGGLCYDSFCQYFGIGTECLGCKPGYQYGSKGECIPQKNDPNCKEFLNGQCKICSDRYYFDQTWKCTNISTLCRSYNPNNGQCTSCYSGYALEEGRCIRESQRIICEEFQSENKSRCARCMGSYVLDQRNGVCQYRDGGCVRRNVSNRACLRCMEEYVLDQGSGYCLKVGNYTAWINNNINPADPNNNSSNTTTTPPNPKPSSDPIYMDPNCIQYPPNRTLCLACISRMYYSPGDQKCIPIDPNCKTYISVTGQCTACYDGYNVTESGMGCQLERPRDKNCKRFGGDGGNGVGERCLECYDGYYWEKGRGECTLVDALCKGVDLTNGDCLSCWPGYVVKVGRCVVQLVEATATSLSPDAQKALKCQQYDPFQKICLKCLKSTAFDLQLQTCQYPIFGFDVNCLEYRNKICTKCKDNYKLKNQLCKPNNRL